MPALIAIGVVATGGAALVTWLLTRDRHANYVVFDSPDVAASVRVDGHLLDDGTLFHEPEGIGPDVRGQTGGRHPLVARLGAGRHQVEIVRPHGEVLETATIELPARDYRAIYTVGAPRRYALITVVYGRWNGQPEQRMLRAGSSPHLTVLPDDTSPLQGDYDSIDAAVPPSILSNQSPTLHRLCTVSERGLGCSFETQ